MNNLRLYTTICYEDSTIVGTMQSEPFDILCEDGQVEFRMDVSNVVSGRYYFYLDVFSINEYGTHLSYDHPLEKIYFEIEEKTEPNKLRWQRRYYGNVRLKTINVINNRWDNDQ